MDNVAQHMAGPITPFEKKLIESQQVFEIRGKTGKAVPVIIPRDALHVLEFISNPVIRDMVDVSTKNPYIFASERCEKGVIRAYDSVKAVASKACLDEPWRITSVNLRKFMATMVQTFDLSQQEMQWVCDHLGHTLDVHRIHYRSTSEVIERLHIAILLCQENPHIVKYQGKKLVEIPLEGLVKEIQPEEEVTSTGEGRAVDETHEQADIEALLEKATAGQEEREDEDFVLPTQEKIVSPRHTWTIEEIEETKVLFKDFFRRDVTPGSDAVMKAMAQSKKMLGHIRKLKPDNIKKKVSWIRLHNV